MMVKHTYLFWTGVLCLVVGAYVLAASNIARGWWPLWYVFISAAMGSLNVGLFIGKNLGD